MGVRYLAYDETMIVRAPQGPRPRWPREVEDRSAELIEEAEWLTQVVVDNDDMKALACALETLLIHVAVEDDGHEAIWRGRNEVPQPVQRPLRNFEETIEVLLDLLLDLAAEAGAE